MLARIGEHISQHSGEFTTFVLAMLPISELRGAIPYAITVAEMDWPKAYFIAVAGNFVPVIPILYLIDPISNFCRRFRWGDQFFTWLFGRTRKKGKIVERLEAVGLVLFVALPLPVTGAWTGSLAASLFGVRKRLAIPAVFLGICLAGALVTLASLGVISLWSL